MDIVVPILVALFVYAPLIHLATRGLEPAQQRLLRPVLYGAFGLRVVVSTIFAVFPATRVFHEDAGGTEFIALRIAGYWFGDGVRIPDWEISERNYGLTYFFAGVLSVTGRYALNITIFNSFIGTMNAMLVYRIGNKLADHRIALRAAQFMAFFPSMIIWSSIALKDPLMCCCISITLLSAIALRERTSPLAIMGCVAPMIVVYPIRFYLVYFIAASLLGTMALGRKGKIIAGLSKQALLLVLLGVIVVAFGLAGNAKSDLDYFDLQQVSTYRRGMAVTANSAFAADVDISTPGQALAFLPIGLGTLIWGPFPWQMTSLRPLLSAPEMLVWWYLAPSLVRGTVFAARQQFRLFAPILVFASTTLIGYSLTLGNLGAAYRMRAQVFGFLFILVALGQYLAKARAAGIDELLLLRGADPPKPVPQRLPPPALARN